jgi:hypothetical protein
MVFLHDTGRKSKRRTPKKKMRKNVAHEKETQKSLFFFEIFLSLRFSSILWLTLKYSCAQIEGKRKKRAGKNRMRIPTRASNTQAHSTSEEQARQPQKGHQRCQPKEDQGDEVEETSTETRNPQRTHASANTANISREGHQGPSELSDKTRRIDPCPPYNAQARARPTKSRLREAHPDTSHAPQKSENRLVFGVAVVRVVGCVGALFWALLLLPAQCHIGLAFSGLRLCVQIFFWLRA